MPVHRVTLPDVITDFRGPHEFLSNFAPGTIWWNGRAADTVEHHYQAAKTTDPVLRDRIYEAPTPGQAHRLGDAIPARPGWDDAIKRDLLTDLLATKFSQRLLREKLLGTGDALLIAENTWHDNYLGQCTCPRHRPWPGHNRLGQTLMQLRDTVRDIPALRFPRVALTGHRPDSLTLEQLAWVGQVLPALAVHLRDTYGTRVAISGMALGSDTVWAEAALGAGLRLWAYIPFEEQPLARGWTRQDQVTWARLRGDAARTLVLGHGYSAPLLHARNRYMVRDADLLVAVHREDATKGGTVQTMLHAEKVRASVLRVNVTTREVVLVRPGAAPIDVGVSIHAPLAR